MTSCAGLGWAGADKDSSLRRDDASWARPQTSHACQSGRLPMQGPSQMGHNPRKTWDSQVGLMRRRRRMGLKQCSHSCLVWPGVL